MCENRGVRRALPIALAALVCVACGDDAPAGAGPGDAAAGVDGAPDPGGWDAADASRDDAGSTAPSPAACLADPTCAAVFTSAHRAKCGGEPENTIAGMRACAAAGVPMLELDTRQTADGHVVLMHDTTVERTTDGETRFPGRFAVDQLTLAEFESLVVDDDRCAADPEAAPERCHPPSWPDALAAVADAGVVLFIDLKASDATRTIEDAVAAGMGDRVVLFDSDLDKLAAGRAVHPSLVVMPRVGSVADIEALLADPRAPALDLRWLHADGSYLAAAHAVVEPLGIRLYLNTFGEVDAFFAAAGMTSDPADAQAARDMALTGLAEVVQDGGRALGCEFCVDYLPWLRGQGLGLE